MGNPYFTEADKRKIRQQIDNLKAMLNSTPDASNSQKERWRNEIANLQDRLTWKSNPDRGF